MCSCLLDLLPGDILFLYGDIPEHLRDDKFVSLIPHIYAVAEKAVWTHRDQTGDDLVEIACRISLAFHHLNVAACLCQERLKTIDTSATIEQQLSGGRLCHIF